MSGPSPALPFASHPHTSEITLVYSRPYSSALRPSIPPRERHVCGISHKPTPSTAPTSTLLLYPPRHPYLPHPPSPVGSLLIPSFNTLQSPSSIARPLPPLHPPAVTAHPSPHVSPPCLPDPLRNFSPCEPGNRPHLPIDSAAAHPPHLPLSVSQSFKPPMRLTTKVPHWSMAHAYGCHTESLSRDSRPAMVGPHFTTRTCNLQVSSSLYPSLLPPIIAWSCSPLLTGYSGRLQGHSSM
jgi:hypothetical protein